VETLVLDEFADEEVAPRDVLGAAVVLRVVGEIDCRLVVHVDVDGRGAERAKSELFKKLAVVGCLDLAASEAAMISASQEERATNVCCVDAHSMVQPCHIGSRCPM